MHDLVIIGGGPGGVSAAIYAIRAGMKTLLIDKLGIGGQIAKSDIIENYPGFPSLSGRDLMANFETHIKALDCPIEYLEARSVKPDEDGFAIDVGANEPVRARSVIVATGADPKLLGFDGENEYYGRGISYCATCDGPFYRNKEIAVLGGGDTAVKESIFLSKIVKKLHLVHRRDELRAEKVLQDRIMKLTNVQFHWSHVARAALGDETGVTGIAIAPATGVGELKEIKVDGIFVFVGIKPNTDFVTVDKDTQGFIKVNDEMMSSVPGIFAIGDCRVSPLRQVATAVGDGAIAAVKAEEYLSSR